MMKKKKSSRENIVTQGPVGRIETYDRRLESEASNLAENKNSDQHEKVSFAEKVISSSRSMAEAAIARRLGRGVKISA